MLRLGQMCKGSVHGIGNLQLVSIFPKVFHTQLVLQLSTPNAVVDFEGVDAEGTRKSVALKLTCTF